MNGYDVFLVAIIAVSILMGLIKGLVREVFSLAGVFLGVAIALIVSPNLAHRLNSIIPSDTASYAAAFLILFLATLFVMSLLGVLLSKLLDMARLGIPNRMLGGVFGLVRGVLTALIITLGLTLFLEPEASVLARSRIVPHLVFGARLLAPLLPGRIESVLLDRLRDLPEGQAKRV